MQNRVSIFSIPRSGSTYLCDALKTYVAPETNDMRHLKNERGFGHEPFHPDHTLPTIIPSIIERFYNTDRFVMKLQFSELELINKSGFIDKFKSLNTYNIVLLRKDIFESALSLAVAIAKDEFINVTKFDPIFINPDSCIFMINMMLDGYNQLVNNIHNIEINEIIFYEDLTFVPKVDFENTKMYKQDPFLIKNCVLDKCEYKSPPKISAVKNYVELRNIAIKYLSNKSINGIKITNTTLEIL